MIRINSQISLQEMADKIGKSKKIVQRIIDKLEPHTR